MPYSWFTFLFVFSHSFLIIFYIYTPTLGQEKSKTESSPIVFFGRSKFSWGPLGAKNVPTQIPLVERVFCSFWAPFGALHPLGDFPEKCHFGGFFLYVSLWELFAIPHTYILSSGLSWLLRFTCFSSLFRLYPSCSLVFVLFASLLFKAS